MAYGDLGAVVDTLQYASVSTRGHENVHVVDDIFAVFHRAGSGDNYIQTFSIDSLGEISDAIIDDLNHSTSTAGDWNKLAKLTDTLYAIATTNMSYQLTIDTFSILANGQISDTFIDFYNFPAPIGIPAKLRKCGPLMLAMTDTDAGQWDGWLHTIKINGDGTIDHTYVDSLKFETDSCWQPWLEEIHPTIWAVVYQRHLIHTQLRTFSITAGGIIGPTELDSLNVDSGGCKFPSIAKAHGDFVAIGYTTTAGDGKLAIVEIDENGDITDTVIDSYVFETGTATRVNTYTIGQGYIGVAYANAAGYGVLKTFLVDGAGSLNNTTIDTLAIVGTTLNWLNAVHVTGDVWAVTHSGSGTTGEVDSFGLETPPEPGVTRDLMRGMLR